jgi:hypothetical protein
MAKTVKTRTTARGKSQTAKSPLDCAREVMNYTSIKVTDRFDKPRFDKTAFLANLSISSPKLVALLNNIEMLDKKDYSAERKLYKHYIFSDLKKGYGAKIIASAFAATGYDIVMKKQGSKIVLDQNLLNQKNESKFAVLSSTALWDTPVDTKTTKMVLAAFNERPGNVFGDKIRFIILDSGFKEGIDLFDIKYAHIFEDQRTQADFTQSVGRGTRFCGQKGLKFGKGKGWDLNVYNYKLYKPVKKFKFFENKEVIMNILQKDNTGINTINDISQIIQDTAVDYYLNKNINNTGGKYSFLPLKPILLTTAAIATLAGLVYRERIKGRQNKENVRDLENFVKRFGKTARR